MAAFRARSLGRGLTRVCWEVDFGICASLSVTLMLIFSPAGFCAATSYCPGCCGGLVSLTCGMLLAIEVSGMPAFRGGGGGWESREYGWYAVLVCIFRFEDICNDCAEEKVRRT